MSILLKKSAVFDLTVHNYFNKYILKLTFGENRKGIIYRATAVLFAHGYEILEANLETVDGTIKDVFVIRGISGKLMNSEEFLQIKKEMQELLLGDVLVIDYLNQFSLPPRGSSSSKPPIVYVYNPEGSDCTVLDIHTQDRPGLLFDISQLLYIMDIDIISVVATTENEIARDTFLIRVNGTEKLDESTQAKLKEGLMNLL